MKRLEHASNYRHHQRDHQARSKTFGNASEVQHKHFIINSLLPNTRPAQSASTRRASDMLLILNFQVGFASAGVACSVQFAARSYGFDSSEVRELVPNAGDLFLKPFNRTVSPKEDSSCVSRVEATRHSANVANSNPSNDLLRCESKYTAYMK